MGATEVVARKEEAWTAVTIREREIEEYEDANCAAREAVRALIRRDSEVEVTWKSIWRFIKFCGAILAGVGLFWWVRGL